MNQRAFGPVNARTRGVSGHTAGYERRVRAVHRAGCGALVASLSLCACVGPARTPSAFRLKVRGSAKAAASAVATSEFLADLVRHGRVFAPYASVVLDSADRDISAVQSTFESIQPPDDASDQLRSDFSQVLTNASDAVSSMRIASRRRDWPALLDAAKQLPALTVQFEHYESLPA